ncbi:MAG: hypothetical protein WCV67_09960 [Victivallaceae bacterium]|jgi:hypothetical protein
MSGKEKTMGLSNRTRYQPVDNGYEIIGSREFFNRTLYGAHANDDLQERYFTFAGDLPLFMGAVTDWTKNNWGNYAKSGVLMSGLALAPGLKIPSFYSQDVDVSSHWFHNSEDIVAVFRNGWMEYEFCQFSPWFPVVKVNISVFPLMPEDGFLVHYRIKTDQRIIFCAGFGGMTDFISRLEYPQIKARNFNASDCENNSVSCGRNRALLKGARCDSMWIGSNFNMEVEAGDALSLQDCAPGMFLKNKPAATASQVVKMSAIIDAGKEFEGFIVAVRNADESVLDKWLNLEAPVEYLKQQIHAKQSGVTVNTPDVMLNLTVPPTILAMDASWHKNIFYHGAHAYHAPFLGWRNWYGPTVIGWHDRVENAIKAHFTEIIKAVPGAEAVWYDGKDRPDLDHEGSQYHQIRNSIGFIPAKLGGNDIYNMQEVALDMLFHHLEWQGGLDLAKELFDDIKGVLDWEERILDPDQDGLYQNFLNTWISDGHSYNGGGCAQASSYNYLANLMMARIAKKLGYPDTVFKKRAEKILKAIQEKLWLPAQGVIAEFIDTIGNKLVHPSPELATIYLAIDCGVADMFQAYQMLRFTETDLRNEQTLNRHGRLVYSSNWYPKKYSTCGLFTAENIHLALAYFQCGLKKNGLEILDALADAYFLGKNPGMAAHVLSAHGISDGGDLDFSDVSSMYLRLIVEGLYGIRFHLVDDIIEVAPNFPADWTQADIKLKDIALNYHREGCQEMLTVYCEKPACKRIKLPLRSNIIEKVLLNDTPVNYKVEAAVNNCYLIVETEITGVIRLQVTHGKNPAPTVECPAEAFTGDELAVKVSSGEIIACRDTSGSLERIYLSHNKLSAKVKAESGSHTVFIRVKDEQYDAWLATDFMVQNKTVQERLIPIEKSAAGKFEPLDIARYFNCSLTVIHTLEYRTPRPAGYSIGVRLNGRYAWDWNQHGHNALQVDDTALRQGKGMFYSPSGIGFSTPEEGLNVACTSIWDNFPTVLEIPLTGKASELALLFIGVTNPMQSRVENARFTVTYADGSTQSISMVNPENFDDWLNAALQTQNETVYFSDYNHGMVQRIKLDTQKELSKISIEAIANEVIIGLIGISIRK